jgi:hypothetical protein
MHRSRNQALDHPRRLQHGVRQESQPVHRLLPLQLSHLQYARLFRSHAVGNWWLPLAVA